MTGKGLIRREIEQPKFARSGGASTTQMITPETGAKEILNGFTNIPPGGGIALHFHNCEESVLIVSGDAIVEINDTEQQASAPDVVWVDAGVHHRFRNASDTEWLRIFWTYASADATRTFVETGEERRVAVEHDTLV